MQSMRRPRRRWVVAPHWGAWIEIQLGIPMMEPTKVAPHWGAWIEMPPRYAPACCPWSHPTGVRGLKFTRQHLTHALRQVAPHWGAWIEIYGRRFGAGRTHTSHPTGVRGLKYSARQTRRTWPEVAPHWGAWIEILRNSPTNGGRKVAPHWGAWIEMLIVRGKGDKQRSHPTGVRGLKLQHRPVERGGVMVAPHWGAWIEIG